MLEVSIIIVNYQSREKVFSCLRSIYASDISDLQIEVIVVDNNSGDGIGLELSVKYPQAKFIQNSRNSGMGSGNNLGIRRASAKDYILILNPDTELRPDALKKMADYLEAHAEAGLVGPKLVYPNGTLQQSYFRFPSLLMPLFRRTFFGKFAKDYLDYYLLKNFDNTQVAEVDWIMGSCLMIRKNVLDDVGLFDERFFMYFEDTDLCRRIKQAGWKIIYFPFAEATHQHTRASAHDPWYLAIFKNKLSRVHIVSALRYFRKWGG
jgi:GT2 family glycosyltransferase